MTHNLNASVRIAHRRCRYDGYVGTVAEINHDNQFPYGVSGLEDWLLWFGDGELVHVEAAVVGA